MASYVFWPEKFLPGYADSFISNEVIVKDLSAAQVWPLLVDVTKWESYYWNASQITSPPSGPQLKQGDKFFFSTFGFPPLPCEVTESVPPSTGKPGRLAWCGGVKGDDGSPFEAYHAWIVEDLDRGRVRILTQETQNGKLAAELLLKKPNPMLNGHQDWLDGLAKAAQKSG